MDPPPAPISISSRVEMRTGKPLPSMKRRSRAPPRSCRRPGLAVVDDAELGGRAAHVEGQHVGAAVAATQMGGDQRARRWSGFQQLHRRAFGLLDAA